MNHNHTKIEQALKALLGRKNLDAFAIFEDNATGKFVQFTGSADDGLMLDLPMQALSEAEAENATQLFKTFGQSGPNRYPLFTDEKMEVIAGMQTSFQLTLGQNTAQATELSMAIFKQVYGFPTDFNLTITEN